MDNEHDKLMDKLEKLPNMLINDGNRVVLECLKYLMNCVDPKMCGWKAKDHE
jgi:hypothetical protein